MTTHVKARSYVVTWIGLLALTAASFSTSLLALSPAAEAAVALLIATVKAGWVALVFMHLIEARFANRVTLASAAAFVVLLAALMVADVTTRHTMPARAFDLSDASRGDVRSVAAPRSRP